MRTIATGHRLKKNAAASYARMQAVGMPAGGINSSYRDPAEQVRLFLARYRVQATGNGPYGDARTWKGVRYVRHSAKGMVAIPGTSEHERGLALDIDTDSPAHAWMLRHGAAHGWVRNIPAEPWHFEYRPALDTKPTPPKPASQEEEQDMMFIARKGKTTYVLVRENSTSNISEEGALILRADLGLKIIPLPFDDVTSIQNPLPIKDVAK